MDGNGRDVDLTGARASSRPIYRELAPAPDLAEYVACGWVRVVGPRESADAVPIVPDGCSDILVSDGVPPRIVGPDTRTRWIKLHAGTVITGQRLRPGALRAVLGVRASELVDTSAALADLASSARALHSRLDAAGTLNARLLLLESWVRDRLAPSARDRAVVAAARVLARSGADMDRLATNLGWNVRMLHREFVATCGYGPKYLQRVVRVQRTVGFARAAGGQLRLSDLAGMSGFSDQAHLTRDFRAIFGFTPREYLATAEPQLGRWLTENW